MFTGANAVAAIVSSGTPSGCIYVLNATAQRAMDVEGSEVQTTCGIYINSSNSVALYIGGNPPGGAGTPAISASAVSIVGNYQNGGQGTIVPTPQTGTTAVADPLASLAEPTRGILQRHQLQLEPGHYHAFPRHVLRRHPHQRRAM
jgi:hypothetical protein